MRKKWIEFWAVILLIITVLSFGFAIIRILARILNGFPLGFWGISTPIIGILCLVIILFNKKLKRALQ